MGMPKKLKDFNVFNNGNNYIGVVPELTLPKLTRKMEEYIAGGMSGPINVDYGNEAITFEWTIGGLAVDALKQYGALTHNAVPLRFSGAYQDDDSGKVAAVEILIRGRHKEIDMGSVKMHNDTAHKFSTVCSYYKLSVDGESLIELDFINGIEIIGGKDMRADIRKAIGL